MECLSNIQRINSLFWILKDEKLFCYFDQDVFLYNPKAFDRETLEAWDLHACLAIHFGSFKVNSEMQNDLFSFFNHIRYQSFLSISFWVDCIFIWYIELLLIVCQFWIIYFRYFFNDQMVWFLFPVRIAKLLEVYP